MYTNQAELFAPILENMEEAGSRQVRNVLQTIREKRGGRPDRVLDIGCGIGRHAIGFAEEGCRVDGIDISEAFVKQAREKAEQRGVADRASFEVFDMRDLDEWDENYDLVTNLFDSFCYYGKETDRAVLSKINDLLEDDGYLFMQLGNKEATIRNFEESTVKVVNGNLHVQQMEFDVKTSRLSSTIDVFSIIDDGYEHEDTMEFERRLYAPAEFRDMLETAGFDEITMIGEGANPGPELTFDSPRLVVLAT
ncbi:SAM-dependent methyltransferase [Natronorubrum texcoconense]|uniref:SAM-dependent methyltransferase n=1 Tax=Natronorubrum texcoconense TaxID=1095776 RepID=UPI0015875C9E|nr:class I SAM-dependent methyltransferase [Natronorubrum texcoconense]